MLLLQVLVSCAFLGAAALLSAGMVQIVERPVAPWKVPEQVPVVAEGAPVSAYEPGGTVVREPVDAVEMGAPIDPRQAELILRQARVEELDAKR